MVEKELTAKEDPNYKPLLPAEKTYGEKVHHFVFDTMINFWATLAISGLFVFWLKHSQNPLPQTFFKGRLPREYHTWFRDRFAATPLVKILPESAREEVSHIMADALSINIPGTATILPSLWISAKVKTPMVEWLDRKHYGKDCEKDPRIAERHHIVETERKPTGIGAVFARLGSMTASVLTGYAIGARAGKNLISRIPNAATRKFPGVDHWAGQAGEAVGHTLAEASPALDRGVNRTFKRWWNVGWEPGQVNTHGIPHDTTQPYNNALHDWSKWTSLDIMYTTVTSTTVHYFKKLLDHVPFMSYKEKPQRHMLWYENKPRDHAERDKPAPVVTVATAPVAPTPVAPTANEPTPTGAAAEPPRTQINNAQLYTPVNAPRVMDAGV